MTSYDYLVLVFYFVFMLAISWVFRHFVTNVSDYFRGGGKVVWWMVGGSAFMVQFSAWTFTGAASQAYRDGWPIIVIYLGNALGFLINALHFAPKFRQLRVVTGIQAVRQRFGRATEQFFVWVGLPLGLMQAGIWLNSLGVFFSAVFGGDLMTTIVATGVVVLIMALIGGSWAVIASDFIQVLILMPVCIALCVLALIKIGGFGAFVDALPAGHLDPGAIFSKEFLGFWCLAMLLKQLNTTNNLLDASRYLCAKDSRHARWAGYLGSALFVVSLVIWFLPPMAARVLLPDLQALYPNLKNPEEASFIAIAQAVLPVGMIGILVSGIFAATMSSMDSGLNKNAGVFIKNFYQPFVRPGATDDQLLRASKFTTIVLGLIVIGVAIKFSELKDMNLFKLTQRTSILIAVPIVVPLMLGLIIRRTPPWSAWSTVLVGFTSSLFISDYLTPEWAAPLFGYTGELTASSREYWRQGIEMVGNFVIGGTWFCITALFWKYTPAADKAEIEAFSQRIDTPVDFATEEGAENANDARQCKVVGWLCAAYGGFVVALALIPNPIEGRIAFVGCGGMVLLVAWLLLRQARKPAAA